MEYKIAYIDDEGKRDTFADSLKQDSNLSIEPCPPANLEKTRNNLLKENYDGIILDLKLDGNKEGGQFADYTAPSLALALRSKFIEESSYREVPIFLLTSQDNLEKYYNYDLSGHDLFDYIFFKQKLSDTNNYAAIIEEIVTGYSFIAEKSLKLADILNINLEDLSPIIFPTKYRKSNKSTIYEMSNYLIQQVINKSGILINEKILAARLGVDIQNSSDWDKLKEDLKEIQYTGLYSNIFPRWWNHKLINWWRKLSPTSASLISLTAKDRIDILNDKLGYNLKAAEPIKIAKNSRFWTICQVYEKPLDIRDGILIEGNENETWHDKSYISLESILERKFTEKGFHIHPTEKERVNELKRNSR